MEMIIDYKSNKDTPLRLAWVNWTCTRNFSRLGVTSTELDDWLKDLLNSYNIRSCYDIFSSTRSFIGAEEDLLRFIMEWS